MTPASRLPPRPEATASAKRWSGWWGSTRSGTKRSPRRATDWRPRCGGACSGRERSRSP